MTLNGRCKNASLRKLWSAHSVCNGFALFFFLLSSRTNAIYFSGRFDNSHRIGLVLFVIIFFTYYNILQPVYITESAIKELRNMFYYICTSGRQASIFIVQNRKKKQSHLTNRNCEHRECADSLRKIMPFNLCVHNCRCRCRCRWCYKCSVQTYHFGETTRIGRQEVAAVVLK